ncbi:MAG: DedD protein [Pseudomonadota bacterium]|nr:DedD protein [Pseudomonadota bacterium]
MSFEITEQVKYRLTGGVILITAVFLFMPMMMKKSNQRFEENLSLSLKVPPKPQTPELTIPTAQQVFNKVKPNQPTAVPQVAQRPVKIEISKAERLESEIPTLPLEMAKPIIQLASEKSGNYGVQLASFSHVENADFLVKRLRKLGYDAQASSIDLKNGKIYKVVVGQLKNKDQAIKLQKQLAENTQLKGMIIVQG